MLAKPKKRTMLWAAAGVLAVGIAAPAIAAQAADPTPSASANSAGAEQGRKGPGDDKLAAALAQELGIDQQKVADALAKVREQIRPAQPDKSATAQDRTAQFKARLDQAVKDGKLTQAEADAILKAQSAGVLGGAGGHGRGGKPAA